MKELTIEEKAERYDEAINVAKSKIKNDKNHTLYEEDIINIFPELKESEDERIKKALLKMVNDTPRDIIWDNYGVHKEDAIDWFENQGNVDNASYEIAEKEKHDFVNGQFIDCRKSFDEFKEDNSYWLEYVGNDIYIGRSDNILGKEFHITPRQLYCLFAQQHCPKESNMNEETNAPTEYEYALKSFKDEDVRKFMQYIEKEAKAYEFNLPNRSYDIYAFAKDILYWLEKQGEQNPVDNVEHKFNVGDIIRRKGCVTEYTITKVTDTTYYTNAWSCGIKACEKDYELVKQKPAEWSEDDERVIVEAVYYLEQYNSSKPKGFEKQYVSVVIDKLKSIEDRVARQEWSEEDEKKRNLLIDILNVNHPNGYFKVNPANTLNMEAIHTEELVDWLKSLKDRVLQPQPKQEWDKDDETRLTNIIIMLKEGASHHFIKDDITKAVAWLKSLRPQKQWKPTEEQINALKWQVDHTSEGLWQYKATKELLEQLKQL